MSKITLSVEGMEPIVIETNGAVQSQESFPKVNLKKWKEARKKLYLTIDEVTKIPEVREVCDKVKEFAEEKQWTILKRLESNDKKTLFTEIFKATGNSTRPYIENEVWKDINGVPVCFLVLKYPKRAFPHVFFRKNSGGKIFTKQIAGGFDLVPPTPRGEDHTTDSIWAGI